MVSFAAVAGGVSAAAAIAGTYTSIKANKQALHDQKQAMQLEAEHAKQRAEIEDRQLVKSLNLAERQAEIGIAEQERQAFGAASEDKLAIQTELDTANLSAAQRAAEIRRELMSTLGEQRATLAARGVSSGSLRDTFDTEARTAAADDLTTNEITRRMAEGGAAADVRGVDTSLTNMRSSNALGLLQQHQSASAQLTMIREGTKNELRWQKEAADKGYQSAQNQTKYANAAALIQGFAALAGTGYDFMRSYNATEPGPKEPVKYKSPKPLTTSNSAVRFSSSNTYGVR
jgi:hypothetical protein